ncbi:MAG: hypothetical protein WAL50_18215 [Kineosporiaceae bacterium]
MKQGLTGLCAAAAVGLVLAGCAGPSTPSQSTPSPGTPSASPTADPTQVLTDAAIEGYHAARKVQAAIEANPRARLADYPPSLHITDALTGQALDLAVKAGTAYTAAGRKVTTEMAGSTPTVKSVDLATNTVVLVHCPLDEQRTVTVKGQPMLEVPPSGQAKPPNLVTYTMQRIDARWKLAQVSADGSRTCTADI